MNKKGGNGWIFFLLFIFVFSGGFALLPLLLIVAAVIGIAFAAVKASNNQDERKEYGRTYSYQSTGTYTRAKSGMTAAETAKINVFMRKWYRTHGSLPIGTGITLNLHGSRYTSLSALDVYRDNTYICSLSEFQSRFPDSYRNVLIELKQLSERTTDTDNVFDAQVTEVREEEVRPKKDTVKQESQQPKEPEKGAQYYIDVINNLNANIPDEEITNGLYETTALLKQIQNLELTFPKSKSKLEKLYAHYLPYLVNILKQYSNLQYAQTDDNYERTRKQLSGIIKSINEAMKNIIKNMTDADMMNLAADISTLEAVLRKDGMTEAGTMSVKGE